MTTRASAIFAILVAAVAALAVVGGFMVIGSPDRVRKQRLDQIRSANLQALAHAVSAYRSTHDAIPASLAEIPYRTVLDFTREDPEGHAYVYKVTGTDSYELCADFALASGGSSPGILPQSVFTVHPAGFHCFPLEARRKSHD